MPGHRHRSPSQQPYQAAIDGFKPTRHERNGGFQLRRQPSVLVRFQDIGAKSHIQSNNGDRMLHLRRCRGFDLRLCETFPATHSDTKPPEVCQRNMAKGIEAQSAPRTAQRKQLTPAPNSFHPTLSSRRCGKACGSTAGNSSSALELTSSEVACGSAPSCVVVSVRSARERSSSRGSVIRRHTHNAPNPSPRACKQ